MCTMGGRRVSVGVTVNVMVLPMVACEADSCVYRKLRATTLLFVSEL